MSFIESIPGVGAAWDRLRYAIPRLSGTVQDVQMVETVATYNIKDKVSKDIGRSSLLINFLLISQLEDEIAEDGKIVNHGLPEVTFLASPEKDLAREYTSSMDSLVAALTDEGSQRSLSGARRTRQQQLYKRVQTTGLTFQDRLGVEIGDDFLELLGRIIDIADQDGSDIKVPTSISFPYKKLMLARNQLIESLSKNDGARAKELNAQVAGYLHYNGDQKMNSYASQSDARLTTVRVAFGEALDSSYRDWMRLTIKDIRARSDANDEAKLAAIFKSSTRTLPIVATGIGIGSAALYGILSFVSQFNPNIQVPTLTDPADLEILQTYAKIAFYTLAGIPLLKGITEAKEDHISRNVEQEEIKIREARLEPLISEQLANFM